MEIEFDELDYTKMIANPMVVAKKKSPEDVYDIFRRYKEFSEPTPDMDRKKLFRYIPLVYDKKSPLHEVIDDIKRLKGKAAELAGFIKQDDGEFLSSVKDLLACKNPVVNAMIVRYVTLHKSAQYHRYVILSEAYDKKSAAILHDASTSDIKSFETLADQIDDLKQELLSGDNTQSLQESFDDYYFADKLQLRPEDIATKRAKGVPII